VALYIITPHISVKQAKVALILLKTFTEQSNDMNDKVYFTLNMVENTINNVMCKNLTEIKILNYFL